MYLSRSHSPARPLKGEELVNLAQQKNLKIMVDHTFLFSGAVRRIAQLIDEGALGNLYYYDSTRVNLGLFQHDINVFWDLRHMTSRSWTISSRPAPKPSWPRDRTSQRT